MFEEVAIPTNEMRGVAPPEEVIGHAPVTAVTPEMVEVAMNARPFRVLLQPRTWPPTPVPYKVEVAIGAVFPVAAFPRTPAACDPKEVVLPTEVTTPLKLALVVTVAALPPILREEVATSISAEPFALLYRSRLPVTEERPVPPFRMAAMPVMLSAVPPMLRVVVACHEF